MTNKEQCSGKLLYKSFAMVYMDTFTSQNINASFSSSDDGFIERIESDFIDTQIFTTDLNYFKRYNLEGFDFVVDIQDGNDSEEGDEDLTEEDDSKISSLTIKGRIDVKCVHFFEKTILLSFRLVVNQIENYTEEGERIPNNSPCEIDKEYIDTNQLIAISGMFQDLEYWVYDKKSKRQRIDGIIKSIHIDNFPLDQKGDYLKDVKESFVVHNFDQVIDRYHKYFLQNCSVESREIHNSNFSLDNDELISSMKHLYIDIWEDISHSELEGCDFAAMEEAELIEHIEEHHKAEVIGLMSGYPKEWPYRMDNSYKDICGENIAIDTDDLVLVNPNYTVVFGVYGRRGAEDGYVDWKLHLARRDHYQVSWPEHLTLMETVLANRQIINYVWDSYIRSAKRINNNFEASPQTTIKENARLGIKMSHMLMELDAARYLRYISHKYMIKQTYKNMNIDDQQKRLNDAISSLDRSLDNFNSMYEVEQTNSTNNILWYLSIASLFGVMMENNEVGFVSYIFDNKDVGVVVATILNMLTAIGIVVGFVYLWNMLVSYYKGREVVNRELSIKRYIKDFFEKCKNCWNKLWR